MKICILAFLLFALSGCGDSGGKTSQVTVPPDADLKADVMLQGSGSSRTIEVSFYFSKPVAPGVKTAPSIDVIQVEEARFNDTPLTGAPNAAGRTTYTGQGLQVKTENLISIKLNGKQYEGKAMTQTTLPNRSASVVMTPK